MQRIVIIGPPGAGKTTLARQLTQLDFQHVELDALYWKSNWTPTSEQVFRAQVRARLSRERWVVDGNYGSVRRFVWSRATTIVWLDYPLHVTFARLVCRTLQRTLGDEEAQNGNRERFREQFLDSNSRLVTAVRSHRERRRRYTRFIAKAPHAEVCRFATPRQAARWLSGLGLRAAPDALPRVRSLCR